MKIIADENIPYVKQAFASFGEVVTLPGRHLQAVDLQDCDCLLVRSVTRVNQQLLQGTPVQFVASATIGTDHVDLDYLQQHDIGFANAPGCNAESASEYVIDALFQLAQQKGFDPFRLTAGIIGHGNVGSRVKKKLDALGITTLVNDPPLQDAGTDGVNYVSLQTIIHECDFISCHVPLTTEGDYPSFHLFNETILGELVEGTILFNTARGPVIDNLALSELLSKRHDLTVFLDTWEHEPAINPTLLKQVDLATPHIAGYSVEGRLRGTQMILQAAASYFNITTDWSMLDYLPEKQIINLLADNNSTFWFELFSKHYAIQEDHRRLLALAELPADDLAREFDLLRKNYPLRYEYSQYLVQAPNFLKDQIKTISNLLFERGSSTVSNKN